MKYQPELLKLLICLEFISAIVGLFYLLKNKGTYWVWFIFYLNFIFVFDFFSEEISSFLKIKKQYYFAYIIFPIQFIFFYWLYAIKSLKKISLFWSFTIIYFLSFIPIELYFSKLKVVYSFNIVIGTILLMVLIFMEFFKQIKNDDILEFSKNKMFYINIGLVLFYVGTLPFFGLYNLLIKEIEIWNGYYLYFMVSNCIMYLLFAASFIWGKVK
ncbi:MAG: hypothetical protein KA523_03635 [Flavobacterium sp.]|jgi:hypothetical protein|nr:hypothetical protein [Flavobacterium sp.]